MPKRRKQHHNDGEIQHIEQELRQDERKIGHLEHEVNELEHDHHRKPTTGDFHFRQGQNTMADGTILKGQTQIDAVAVETSPDTAIVPANMSWSVDDPSIVTPAINPDGSATFTKVGTAANDRVANVTWKDTFYGLTATHTLTVAGDGSTSNPPTVGDFNFQNGR